MDLISVIVPVYKTEAYLDKCIESIVGQTYKNLEIILVDDGSPDNCPSICDSWAKRDSRIKVLHISNGGAGNARNVGMSVASGEWFSFIDSDDYISDKFFECMYEWIDTDVDVIECQWLSTEGDDCVFEDLNEESVKKYEVEEALYNHIENRRFKQTPVNKLYRNNIVCDIMFPVGKLIDDEFWTYKVLSRARKLISLDSKLYAYRQQNQSVMHIPFSMKRLQALDAKSERLKFIQQFHPSLESIATKDLWLTSIYMGQMVLLHLKDMDVENGFKKISAILAEFPITKEMLAQLSIDYKIWVLLSKGSIQRVCKLRNVLKLGI